jgi:rubrerythrin
LERLEVDSLKRWHDYFTANAIKSREISCNGQMELTDQEKRRIEKSIATFQLGEYSEGKGLLKAAETFAKRIDNEYLVGITRMFIAEEQNHAMLLKKFMAVHGIRQLKRHWADAVFRGLRKDVGFELSITVLITAEIISLVYYKALRANSNSSQLKKICNKILADEIRHVRYESELINYLREQKPRIFRSIVRFLHGVLFSGTIIVVYWSHRRVLNTGGFEFNEFWKACWMEFSSLFDSKALAHAVVRI